MPTRTQQSDLLEAAYASHGDTKHVLLFPASPKECFDLTAESFDLAERLQTPVIVMTDLDLGMNDHFSKPLAWDDHRQFDRGKVLDAAALDGIEKYGRYLDSEGDGIMKRKELSSPGALRVTNTPLIPKTAALIREIWNGSSRNGKPPKN
jgi:2-oxoglutarate ferredoxin oxidoreductase subunit alpha